MLLSNPEVARFIDNETVPYWESVHAVPKVTIDFGDGRVLKRTLMGNTVIYLCLPDGRVIDAFPGVYTPAHFLAEIKKSIGFMRERGASISSDDLRKWHQEQFSLQVISEKRRITFSKALVESPLLTALGMRVRSENLTGKDDNANIAEKDLTAAFDALSNKLEDVSKQPSTVDKLRAEDSSLSKENKLTPEELGKRAVEIDSRNNLLIVRPAVHLLFAGSKNMQEPSEYRDVIYKRILHIALDDPYLGLVDALVPGSPKN